MQREWTAEWTNQEKVVRAVIDSARSNRIRLAELLVYSAPDIEQTSAGRVDSERIDSPVRANSISPSAALIGGGCARL